MFYCSIRSGNSSHQYGYVGGRLKSTSERTPWHSIRTDTAYAPSEYLSSDTSNHPIVENAVRIPRICTVYHRYEVFCVPVRRLKKKIELL